MGQSGVTTTWILFKITRGSELCATNYYAPSHGSRAEIAPNYAVSFEFVHRNSLRQLLSRRLLLRTLLKSSLDSLQM